MRILSYIVTAVIGAGIGFFVAAWLAAMKEAAWRLHNPREARLLDRSEVVMRK